MGTSLLVPNSKTRIWSPLWLTGTQTSWRHRRPPRLEWKATRRACRVGWNMCPHPLPSTMETWKRFCWMPSMSPAPAAPLVIGEGSGCCWLFHAWFNTHWSVMFIYSLKTILYFTGRLITLDMGNIISALFFIRVPWQQNAFYRVKSSKRETRRNPLCVYF